MKTVRVNFVDNAGGDCCSTDMQGFVKDRLSLYYDVVIDPKTPQIVFGNIYGSKIGTYDAIRVLLCREEYVPDFNLYDYAVTIFQDLSYKDRVFNIQVPLFSDRCVAAMHRIEAREKFAAEDLTAKTGFCSFVQSQLGAADPIRVEFFHKLSEYKTVDSGGRLLNNVGGPVTDKMSFEAQHKFSISFINAKNYTIQDRPLDAFAARTLPIYWGNPDIGRFHNTKAFVNVMDYPSLDAVVQAVKEIDNDDARYIEMMNEPVFAPGIQVTVESELKRFDDFLINIVEHGSIQRSRTHRNLLYESWSYNGRRRSLALQDFAHEIKPVADVVFSSKPGQAVRKTLVKAYNGYERRVVERKRRASNSSH